MSDKLSPTSAALHALGISLFERDPSGALLLLNEAPEWLCRLWPILGSRGSEFPVALCPFLANFLIDAAECWEAGTDEQVRSGAWVETDSSGVEIYLEASAFTASERRLLLLQRLGKDFDASRAMLQKARETLIAYQRLSEPELPEISVSLDRLRERYPNYSRCGFLIMRFGELKPYRRIIEAITETAQQHGLSILRADAHEFHADLLWNVKTYLHGCSFGIAVYDRIHTNEGNANVAFEAGYMMAMNKPVLLLKDETLPSLQTDLAGKLYKPFDPHEPETTIPPQLETWLQDYGIVVP